MKTKKMAFRHSLLIGCLFMLSAGLSQAQETQVKVTAIHNAKGNIILNVFKDSESYENQKPYKKIVTDKKGQSNGTLVIPIQLEPGTYGITLIDDENGDGELNKNLIGIPKEGFGFSNFFMEKMAKPAFNDFKIEIKSTTNKIECKVKYM